jgi:hypothetical protein
MHSSIRTITESTLLQPSDCAMCSDAPKKPWDRIDQVPYCMDCIENLMLGTAVPIKAQIEKYRCDICYRMGSVDFQTIPLHKNFGLIMHLCSVHLYDLLSRNLSEINFKYLRAQLKNFSVNVQEIFFLHGAFYDQDGRAIQPVQAV